MNFTAILSEARRFTSTSSTTQYSTAEITESANRALDRVVTLIREAEGRWQFDDSNNTDFSIATAALVADQQDYALDTTHHRVERVEIKDEDGGWHKLNPIDQTDIYNQSLTDFLGTAGIPSYYDKVGNSLFLYPKPNYSQAASIKLFYERGPDYFETTDTTKTIGFNALFHKLIPLWCAYDYAFTKQLKIKDDLEKQIFVLETALKEFYSSRNRDEHTRLKARTFNFR